MLQRSVLPSQIPEQIIEIPTMRRWGSCLPNLLTSLAETLGPDVDRTLIIVADGTTEQDSREVEARAQVLAELPAGFRRNLFVLTPESQASIVRYVAAQSGVERVFVEAYLTWTGYGSQRGKLDMVARSYAVDSDKKVLSLDDDTTLPSIGRVLNPNAIDGRLQRRANSQTILREVPPDEAFEGTPNSLTGFFRPLGSDAKDCPLGSRDLYDTMHGALEEAQRTDSPVQFVVSATPGGEEKLTGRVIATVATKSGVPDYRTVKIAEANLRDGFPEREVPYTSYPSGPTAEFNFQRASTNVDSACIARLFDARTSQLGWWLITNDRVSRENPLQTVTGHYRADNENLPWLFERVEQETGERFLYRGGIDTQVLHHRARSGYRPDIIEQATASLIGNLCARAAREHLTIDRETLQTSLRPISPDYRIPAEWMTQVYQNLMYLAESAYEAIGAIEALAPMVGSRDDDHLTERRIERYRNVYESLLRKTGGFDYEVFEQHTNSEIRKQLEFYRNVLEAAPRIERVVHGLVTAEKYPALHSK